MAEDQGNVIRSVSDTQIGGNHYKDLPIQPWEVYEAWFGREGFESFLACNVLKYIARYKKKNGIEDLRKARHYLDELIELNLNYPGKL